MSLLTRCPACSTHYRLVPDQLRISQGWVKCGQCEEIFDASVNLIHAALKPDDVPDESVVIETTSEKTSDISNEALEPAMAPPQDEITNIEINVDAAEDSSLNQSAEAVHNPELSAETQTVSGDLPLVVVSLPQDSLIDLSIGSVDADHKPQQDATELGANRLSFLRQPDQTKLMSSHLSRPVLLLAVFCLLMSLVTQWLYWDRDRLATAHPAFKPSLQVFCELMKCTIGAVKRIESVSIDSATFNKTGTENYRLSFTIKNSSGLNVAWPSIELTLTDIQDQVMVRRVLSPADLFISTDDLSAASDQLVSVMVKVDANQLTSSISGYRLLAFYP